MQKIFTNEKIKIIIDDMSYMTFYEDLMEVIENEIDEIYDIEKLEDVLLESSIKIANDWCPIYWNEIKDDFMKIPSYKVDEIVEFYAIELGDSFNNFMLTVLECKIAMDVDEDILSIINNVIIEEL